MFNVTGGEIMVILLLGLIVLGPERLPDAMRKAGKMWGELRKMSNSFQDEVRKGFEEPVTEIKKTTATMRNAASFATAPVKSVQKEITKAVTGTTAAAQPAPEPAEQVAETATPPAAAETDETVDGAAAPEGDEATATDEATDTDETAAPDDADAAAPDDGTEPRTS